MKRIFNYFRGRSSEGRILETRSRKLKTGILISAFLLISGLFSTQAHAACIDPPAPGVDWSWCDKSGADLTGADLTGANLDSANLSGAILDNANLTNANLSYANLMMANLTGANLTGAWLEFADLTDVAGLSAAQLQSAGSLVGTWFFGVDMSGWDLSGANLTGAMLDWTNLTGADLTNAVLSGAMMMGANLTGADLTGADLTGAWLDEIDFSTVIGLSAAQLQSAASLGMTNLSGWDMSGWDLTFTGLWGANLAGANLTGANLTNAWLDSADLTGADLTGADLTFADLTNAILDNTDLTNVIGLSMAQLESAGSLGGTTLSTLDMSGWDLTFADLTGWDLTGVDLTGVDLTGADLTNAILDNADLTNVIGLSAAQLQSAGSLIGTNLSGMDMTGWDLTGADLTGADLSNADLTGAILHNTNLTNANLTGANLTFAVLIMSDLTGADLTGATLTDACLDGVDFATVVGLSVAQLQSVMCLSGSNLSGWDMSGWDLTGVSLSWSDLTGADLTGADLSGAWLSTANLTDTDLTNANLTAAWLDWSDLTGADLTDADLTDAFLLDASGTPAIITGTYFSNTTCPAGNIVGVGENCWDNAIAAIDILTPNPANEGEAIHFVGSGSGAIIDGYEWKVDLLVGGTPQGSPQLIGSAADFSYSSLTAGDYRVYFRVKSDIGAWSSEVTQDIIVSYPTVADLVIQTGDIRFLDAGGNEINYVAAGSAVDVEVTVRNPSLFNTATGKPLTVTLYDGTVAGAVVIGTAEISDLGSEASDKVKITWTTEVTDDGCLPVTAVVDYTENVTIPGSVPEISYQNNSNTDTFSVGSATACGGGMTVNAQVVTSPLYAGYKVNIQGDVFYPLGGGIGDIAAPGAKVTIEIASGGSDITHSLSPDGTYNAEIPLPSTAGTYTATIKVTDGEQSGKTTVELVVDPPPVPIADFVNKDKYYAYTPLVSFSGDDVYQNNKAVVNTSVGIKAKVWNLGSADVTGGYDVEFYEGVNLIGTANVVADLAAGSYAWVDSPAAWTPIVAGVYNIVVKVDSANIVSESDELNNEFSRSIDVRERKPDLTASSGSSSPYYINAELYHYGSDLSISATPVVGDTVDLSVEMQNIGTAEVPAAPSFDVTFYDGHPDDNNPIGTAVVNGPIARNAKMTATVSWDTTAFGSGYHTIYVVLDSAGAVDEDFENNNRAYDVFDVYLAAADVWPVEIDLSSYAVINTSLNIEATLKNRGGTSDAGQTVNFYLGDPDAGGSLLGSSSSAAVATGENVIATYPWTTPATAQSKQLCVTANGHKKCGLVYIQGTAPDPSVISDDLSVLPAAPCVGNAVTIKAVIRNTGIHTANNLQVKFYAGAAGNVQVGSPVSISSLPAGGNTLVTATATYVMEARMMVKAEIIAPAGQDVSSSNNLATKQLVDSCGAAVAADAGGDQTAIKGEAVVLDGSASLGTGISHSWAITSMPSGSTATLTDETTDTPTLNTDKVGAYAVELTVTDGQDIEYDTVNVSVSFPAPSGISATDAATGGAVNLGWTSPADGEFDHVHIYRSETSGTLGGIIQDDEVGISYPDTGLSNGTTYYYTVRAVDASGSESVNTGQVSAVPTLPVSADGLTYDTGDDGAGGNDTLPGVNRVDAGADNNNLIGEMPMLDLYYRFSVVFTDDTGETPQQEPRLHLINGSESVYDLSCTGAGWPSGMTCSIDLILAPSSNYTFYFDAIKTAGAALTRLPASGALNGPTIITPSVWSMASVSKDISAANLDGVGAFGATAQRWVSNGLDFEYNVDFNGGWQEVTTGAPVKRGESYFIQAGGAAPDLSAYADTVAATYTITLQPGWNLIGNPYTSGVNLGNALMGKGAPGAVAIGDAAASGWVYNSLWYLNGSSTYSIDSVLTPGMGYWIYLRVDDDTYYLTIPKP